MDLVELELSGMRSSQHHRGVDLFSADVQIYYFLFVLAILIIIDQVFTPWCTQQGHRLLSKASILLRQA